MFVTVDYQRWASHAHREWEIEALSFLMITSQRNGSGPWERHTWVVDNLYLGGTESAIANFLKSI